MDALKDFEGTMIFVSHDRMFLRGLGSRVLELGGESGTDRHPTVYPGSYVEYVQKLGHEAPGIYSWMCQVFLKGHVVGASGTKRRGHPPFIKE